MYRLTLLFNTLFVFNASAMIEKIPDSSFKTVEELKLEYILFVSCDEDQAEVFDIASLEVIEIDEPVEINFDTISHLPVNFNALKGKHDLDWNTTELVELEEDVELNFDTKAYLPKNFNALKGKHDIDWSSIELIEIEEEVELDFNTQDYLPEGFDPYKEINSINEVTVSLY